MSDRPYITDAAGTPLAPPINVPALIVLADAVRLGDASSSTISPAQLDAMVKLIAARTHEDRASLQAQGTDYICARLSIAARQLLSMPAHAVQSAAQADASDGRSAEDRERDGMLERGGAPTREVPRAAPYAPTTRPQAINDGRNDSHSAESRERSAMDARNRGGARVTPSTKATTYRGRSAEDRERDAMIKRGQ